MKGLIVKDICIMMQRKRFFVIMIACGLAMSVSMSGTFIVGWMCILGALFSLNSSAYDEYDNCLPFLMTMPVTRKSYALEKYVFAGIAIAAALVVSLILLAISFVINKESMEAGELIVTVISIVAVAMLFVDISIPVNLKWGSEKGRTVLVLIWGIVFVVGFTMSKLSDSFSLENIQLPDASLAAIAAGCVVLAVVVTAVSALISIRVMENKEI